MKNIWIYAVFLLTFISQTKGLGGVFELRLSKFVNPSGRDSTGECCGDERVKNGICVGECSTKLRVCVKNYQVTIDPSGPCYFGETITEFVYGNNLTNPRLFHFPFNFRWPGTFSLVIEAWHNSNPSNDSSMRLITRMGIQQYLDISEDWKTRDWTSNGDDNSNNRISIGYEYRVRCLPDYYGDACDKYCRPRDDKFGHYTCSSQGDILCINGWTGDYCEKAVCLPGCHPLHGSCSVPNECTCHSGWEGLTCSECVRYPGCKHGSCSKPFGCECDEGWGGLFCNQDLNYCTNHRPCGNGGTCFNTGQGSYTCSCLPGFVGPDCQFRSDYCTCTNGGTCRENGTATFCQCPEGWSGLNCETLSLSCSDTPCLNGGTCVDNRESVTCLCPHGFGGVFCDVPIAQGNLCLCLNGGTCSPQSPSKCVCPAGYSDPLCSTPPMCPLNCENFGKCILINGTNPHCQCELGFTGPLCSTLVNICLTSPCANGGRCTPLPQNKYKCECTENFSGLDCSDPCKCLNGGKCSKNECICLSEYTGPNCSELKNVTYDTLPLTNNDTPSPIWIVCVIIASIATPLMVFVAVGVVVIMKKRKETERRRNDELARIQNEENTVVCLSKNKNYDLVHNTLKNHKCSNLEFNKGSSLISNKQSDYNTCTEGQLVNRLLINTGSLSESSTSSTSSSPNGISPKSLLSSNINFSPGQQGNSPVIYQQHHYHIHPSVIMQGNSIQNNISPGNSPRLEHYPHNNGSNLNSSKDFNSSLATQV